MAGAVLRAAMIGATSLLGKELLEEISNSAAAAWDLKLLEEGDEAEGQLTSAGGEALVVHALHPDAFSGLDVVFFAGSAETTAKYLDPAVHAGASVIDLSNAARNRTGFLVRSPWTASLERPDLTTTGVVIPHPAAPMLSILSERLERRFDVASIAATILEPASQAGSPGVDELHQQTVSLLSFQDVPKAIFGTQVTFNLQGALVPAARVPLEQVRHRVREDLRRILATQEEKHINFTLLQAPVFHGYVISAFLLLSSPVAAQDIETALNGGLMVVDPESLPSNQSAVESGDILVQLHTEASHGKEVWLLLAADNLRLFSRSAVASALELVALRPGSRVQ